MKKKNMFRFMIIAFILTLTFETDIKAQPPNPPGNHGLNGNQGAGGTAPIDGGSIIMLLAGLGYGAVKVIRSKTKKSDKV